MTFELFLFVDNRNLAEKAFEVHLHEREEKVLTPENRQIILNFEKSFKPGAQQPVGPRIAHLQQHIHGQQNNLQVKHFCTGLAVMAAIMLVCLSFSRPYPKAHKVW